MRPAPRATTRPSPAQPRPTKGNSRGVITGSWGRAVRMLWPRLMTHLPPPSQWPMGHHPPLADPVNGEHNPRAQSTSPHRECRSRRAQRIAGRVLCASSISTQWGPPLATRVVSCSRGGGPSWALGSSLVGHGGLALAPPAGPPARSLARCFARPPPPSPSSLPTASATAAGRRRVKRTWAWRGGGGHGSRSGSRQVMEAHGEGGVGSLGAVVLAAWQATTRSLTVFQAPTSSSSSA